MQYLFLVVFVILSVIHLTNCYQGKDSLRTHTKGFLLPFLIIYYLLLCSVHSINFSSILLLALLTSWIGDVMLLRSKLYYFIIGGISFLTAHLCFIPLYFSYIDWISVPVAFLIAAGIIYTSCAYAVFHVLNKALPQPFFYGVLVYLLINGAMNVFAWAFVFSERNMGGLFVVTGSVLFFCSDIVLFLVRFHQKGNVFKGHFIIMLTYILAEFLITQGFFICQLSAGIE